MSEQVLNLVANAGVPAVLLFYLIWNHVAFAKALVAGIDRLTAKLEGLNQEIRQALAAITRLSEEARSLREGQRELEKTLEATLVRLVDRR